MRGCEVSVTRERDGMRRWVSGCVCVCVCVKTYGRRLLSFDAATSEKKPCLHTDMSGGPC